MPCGDSCPFPQAYALLKDDRYGGMPLEHFRGMVRLRKPGRSELDIRLLFCALNASESGAVNLQVCDTVASPLSSFVTLTRRLSPFPCRSSTATTSLKASVGNVFQAQRRSERVTNASTIHDAVLLAADRGSSCSFFACLLP